MRRFHYGWVIVAASFLVAAISSGQLLNCYSLLVVPMCNDFNIPRSAMGLSQTLLCVGGIIMPLFFTRITRKIRLRAMMIVCSAILITGYCMLSFTQNIVQVCLLVVIMSLSWALVCWMPLSILLNNWFYEKIGLAVGIAFMGSGVGGMIFSALGGTLIATVGWRMMVRIYSVIAACILLPVLIFVVRERPEDMGLLPFGVRKEDSDTGTVTLTGARFAEEKKKPSFLRLSAGILIAGLMINALSTTLCPYAEDSGYSSQISAYVSAGYMGALAIGKIILGVLMDKLGARKGTLLSMAALLLSYICLLFVNIPPVFALAILLAGFAAAYCTVALPSLMRHTYGSLEFAAFTSLITACSNIGCTLSPVLYGAVFDLAGSYRYAYMGGIALIAAFGLMLFFSIPKESYESRGTIHE